MVLLDKLKDNYDTAATQVNKSMGLDLISTQFSDIGFKSDATPEMLEFNVMEFSSPHLLMIFWF